MKIPKPGGETTKRFDRLAETFVERGARRGQMFGMPVLKVGDKVFAGTFGDAMTFKLGPADLEKALKATGVEPFEPMGRRMKEARSSPSSTRAAGPSSPRRRSPTCPDRSAFGGHQSGSPPSLGSLESIRTLVPSAFMT